jgi:excisionase family DNA binding protein
MVEVEPRLLRFDEAASLLGCSPSTVRKLTSAGELRTVRLIRDQRIPLKEIDALIQRKLDEGAVQSESGGQVEVAG